MIEVASNDDWHALRKLHGGSSDAAALFDYGYAEKPSAWSVYALMNGDIPYEPDALDGEDRVWIGKAMEPVIAQYVARRHGWDLIAGAKWYVQHPSIKIMGATIDQFVLEHEDGIGIIETKNRDWLEYRDNYFDPETGLEAAAMRDKIQIAHQLATLPEVKWAALAVLVGGNELKFFRFHRSELAEMIADVEAAWVDMERRLKEKDEPDIGGRELPKWLKAHQEAVREYEPPKMIEESTFDDLCNTYLDKDAIAKAAKKEAENAKAAIIQWLGNSARAQSNVYQVEAKRSEIAESVTTRKAHSRVLLKIAPNEIKTQIDREALAAAMAAQAPSDWG